MASSQSDVTQIPSPLWLLQLNRAFPRGVFVFGKRCCCSDTLITVGPPASAWHPARGEQIPPGTAERSWRFATLLQAGGINSTELELLFLEELIGGMR